jgi:hypothetical protein
VTVQIGHSQLHRDLSHDWEFAREQLIKVKLSEAQWATFVSSMNTGSGVPCTLEYVGRERMPDIPLRREADVVKAELRDITGTMHARVLRTIEDIEGEIGKSLSGVKRASILKELRQLERDLGDSLPYMIKSLDQNVENTVEKAKVEVYAYMQGAVARAGLAALGVVAPLQLSSGGDSDG